MASDDEDVLWSEDDGESRSDDDIMVAMCACASFQKIGSQ